MKNVVSRLLPDGYQAPSRIGYRYLDDVIMLDAFGAYTLVRVPTRSWELMSPLDKRAGLAQVYAGLSGLPRGLGHETRLITTEFPFNADAWAERLDERTKRQGIPAPGWPGLLSDTRDRINDAVWPVKRVYLVVRLGDRASYNGAWGRAQRAWERMRRPLDLEDEMPPLDEIEVWHDTARDIRNTLAGSPLRGQPVGRQEAEMLLLHLTHPGLHAPDPSAVAPQRYGPGELQALCGGEVTREPLGRIGKYDYKCLRHETVTGTSYQIWFALSLGPEEINFPGTLWLHHKDALPFPVVQSIGFEIQELNDTRKDADKALRNVEEQFFNDKEAGVSTDLTYHQKRELATQMKYLVDHHRTPFVRMRALFGVADTDKDQLRENARDFVRSMREAGYTVDGPPTHQKFFFYESLPGGRPLDSDYIRRVPLDYLAAGMPHISPAVGDGEGLYQGYTIGAGGQPAEPVFVDHMLYATQSQLAPTEGVPGDPGGGKTVSRGLKPVWEDALRGITQVIWDPKGDYLVLKKYATELGLNPDKIICVNVYDAEAGMLDPAAQAETPEDAAQLMRETLLRLVPDLLAGQSGSDFGDVIRQAVGAAINEGSGSTYLMRVVEILEAWEKLPPSPGNINQERCRQFSGPPARRYREVSRTRLGQLVFGRAPQPFRIPVGYTVIFCTLGLQMPDPGKPPEMMSERELLSDVISGLMADNTWNIMATLDPAIPKAITWDEWHTSKDNPRARTLVDRIKRLGRSRNTFLRLISQSAGDFDSSFVTGVWAFGTTSKDEAFRTCEFLGVEPNDANVGAVLSLSGVGKGVCVFKDRTGKLARMKVEFIHDFVLDIFDTNPEKDPEKMTRIIAEIFGEEAAGARREIEAKKGGGTAEGEEPAGGDLPARGEDDDPVPPAAYLGV
ncbi:ATP-binding protein [Streptomyces sp. NBC_01275]|uniref:ATP-binding protein n=1 Tax=Streptomyces sp. NBC_01275 TaxID=2903807 RepID=UPI00224D9CE0|nr:ATP-binding protein [Streptomyces sp. NBC_01275]MCX4763806.1 ATP-binding protein [Streptomyces sp. NBC_01275]